MSLRLFRFVLIIFMVSERFLSEVFRCTFPQNYCLSCRENHFLEVLFALKL